MTVYGEVVFFLPNTKVKFRSAGDPVLYLSNPNGISRDMRRNMLDGIAKINQAKKMDSGDLEIDARIAQYEMAYRMQTSVPELVDLKDEPQHVLDLYGKDAMKKGTFAHNCLIARRLSERGVPFVQLFIVDGTNMEIYPNKFVDKLRMSINLLLL